MSDPNKGDRGERRPRPGRWLGFTPYQQMLVLPPILFLAGTLTIPGVRPELSVAGGALLLALVLVGLLWPGPAGRRKRRPGGEEPDEPDQR